MGFNETSFLLHFFCSRKNSWFLVAVAFLAQPLPPTTGLAPLSLVWMSESASFLGTLFIPLQTSFQDSPQNDRIQRDSGNVTFCLSLSPCLSPNMLGMKFARFFMTWLLPASLPSSPTTSSLLPLLPQLGAPFLDALAISPSSFPLPGVPFPSYLHEGLFLIIPAPPGLLPYPG